MIIDLGNKIMIMLLIIMRLSICHVNIIINIDDDLDLLQGHHYNRCFCYNEALFRNPQERFENPV